MGCAQASNADVQRPRIEHHYEDECGSVRSPDELWEPSRSGRDASAPSMLNLYGSRGSRGPAVRRKLKRANSDFSWASTRSGGSQTGSSVVSLNSSGGSHLPSRCSSPSLLHKIAIDDLTEVPKDLYESLLLAAQEMEGCSGKHLEHLDELGHQRLVRADLLLASQDLGLARPVQKLPELDQGATALASEKSSCAEVDAGQEQTPDHMKRLHTPVDRV